jgi:hypothetical protein
VRGGKEEGRGGGKEGEGRNGAGRRRGEGKEKRVVYPCAGASGSLVVNITHHHAPDTQLMQ